MSTPQLRASQVVTTFGPGAMVDLPDASVIIAGLDHWRDDNGHIPLIEEPRRSLRFLSAGLASVVGYRGARGEAEEAAPRILRKLE